MNSTKLFLEETYTIDGVTLTGEEIRDAVIDAALLKGKLSQMLGDDLWVSTTDSNHQYSTMTIFISNVLTTINAMAVSMTAKMMVMTYD